jgi:hypothetical protein
LFFSRDKRAEVVGANPGLKVTDVARKLGEMWKSMTEEEKAPWQEIASKDKERYAKEMAEYNK